MLDRRLTAICFDAGNTLLYAHPSPPEIYAEAMSNLGRPVEPDEVGPAFADAWAEMQQRTPPGQDRYSSLAGGERAWWGSFLRQVLERLEHDAPWQHLLDDLYAAFSRADVWRLFPEVKRTLQVARDRGLRLAVVSNWDHRLPEILAQLELDDFFEVVTVSALEGIEKPAPEIFTRTLDRLSVPASTTLHVGDSPREDYQGAEEAGLAALLIDRRRLFVDQDFRRIEALDELLDLF
jgi:putative hydrolase of the HAD superfamily